MAPWVLQRVLIMTYLLGPASFRPILTGPVSASIGWGGSYIALLLSGKVRSWAVSLILVKCVRT